MPGRQGGREALQGEWAAWTENWRLERNSGLGGHSFWPDIHSVLESVNHSASPARILSLPKPVQRSGLEGTGWDRSWLLAATQHTLWVTRVQSPPCAPLGKTAQALLMIPVNSPHNFPYRVCCFVRNQNCTSTGERFRRLSENVKKKASGREVIAPLLIFVNMVFATINEPRCPIRTMVMTHFWAGTL